MSRRGRRAALPESGAATGRGLLGDAVVVRCFAQDGSEQRDFDFGGLPIGPGMQRELAHAFARRTAPGTGLASMKSIYQVFMVVRAFAHYLATLSPAPTAFADLEASHIDGFADHRRRTAVDVSLSLGQLKLLLLCTDELNPALVGKLHEANPSYLRKGDGEKSYSRAEFKQIADTARTDLRAAAERIRRNRALLEQYRGGSAGEPQPRLELLDFVYRHGDVPRRTCNFTRDGLRNIVQEKVFEFGTLSDIIGWAHLTAEEAIAGAVLLTVLTGQNPSVIMDLTAAHHRADGYSGTPATAILDIRKPRRGRRAYMNLVLSEVPDWISIPSQPDRLSARDELHTPFGVYALLIELTARSREILRTDELLVGYHKRGTGPGLRRVKLSTVRAWSLAHDLVAGHRGDDGNPLPLVNLRRIRLSYLEFHQKPVAHTETTLVNDYLGRNRGNLDEYRRVVAEVLTDEVDKARVRGVMAGLTADDVSRARSSPNTVAAEHGVDPVTLKRMIAGELDTVMNACTAHDNSPYAPAGEPCRASFMQCLDCPCARALPRHLPLQALVHQRLEARRTELSPLDWARRFAQPHAQLTDLLARHDETDVADARALVTDADRAVVERFLNREFDIR